MEPKAQCKVCLSYWDVGIVCCTCGHFLRNGTEENKKFVQYTMDLLSIPNYYIKKGRLHGHRYGKKPGDYEYFVANSLKKKCKKKDFLGIHDWFIRDEKFRKNMFDVGRSEELCPCWYQLVPVHGNEFFWWLRRTEGPSSSQSYSFSYPRTSHFIGVESSDMWTLCAVRLQTRPTRLR